MLLFQLLNTSIQHLALELIQEIVYIVRRTSFYEVFFTANHHFCHLSHATAICICPCIKSAISTHKGIQKYSKPRLSQLRLVCKRFKFAADLLLFSEVTFDIYDHDYPPAVVNYLQALSVDTHPARQYARTLRIGTLPNKFNIPQYNIAKDQGLLGGSMREAIQSLRNVRAVHWNIRGLDVFYAIVDALLELPHLEELHLEFSDTPYPWKVPGMIPLRHFKNIRSINISGHSLSVSGAADLKHQLHTILKNGGCLNKLGLSLPPNHGLSGEALHVLHEITQGIPRKSCLQLQHLRLDGYSLKLDSITLPYLRHLTSLDVSRLDHMHAGSQNHLWGELASASIYIKQLVVEEVTSSLLRYLEAYDGLEHFAVQGARMIGRMDSATEEAATQEADELSHELYSSVLPLHKEHLVSFKGLNVLKSRAPSCITYDDMVSLSACTKLHTLVFTLKVSELESDAKYYDIKNIIEMALSLPLITFLQFSYSRMRIPPLRHACCTRKRYVSRIKQRAKLILYSVHLFNGLLGRRSGFCEVLFETDLYVPYITEDGYIRLQ